jgi:serine/threonine protein kinase
MTDELNVGSVIEKYTIEGVLGQGGMAIVYRVRHRVLGTEHALKVLTMTNAGVRRRLLLEGQVQARLTHSNIVSVTDVLDLGSSVGLVMEYVAGTDLATLLDQRRLTFDQCDQLAEGIFRGIEAAHRHGLVHRDLKPANVLLKVEGDRVVPKVADFGLVKDSAELSATRSGVAMGTPRYMSPEQIRDAKSVDARSDLFSLGCLLYAMVTGRDAFSPDRDDIMAVFTAIYGGEFIPVRVARPGVPERIADAIEKALAIEPQDRHPHVAAFRAAWFGGASDEQVWDLAEVTGSVELQVPPRRPADSPAAPAPAEAWPTEESLPRPTRPVTPWFTNSNEDPAPRRRAGMLAGVVALSGLVLTLVGVVGGLRLREPAVVAPAEAPSIPAPVEPEPVVEPAPVAAPEPPPPPEPEAATVTPAPRPTVERPAPAPAPAPTPEPEPVAGPTATPSDPQPARFRVIDARGYLRRDGVDHGPGPVEPGDYAVIAFFDDLSVTVAQQVRVRAGQEVVVTCKPLFKLCDVVVR